MNPSDKKSLSWNSNKRTSKTLLHEEETPSIMLKISPIEP
jgi:hypothetical protein